MCVAGKWMSRSEEKKRPARFAKIPMYMEYACLPTYV
jgi:hypothetical protein